MSYVISDDDVNNVVNEVEEFLEGMLCHYIFYATYNIQWRELLKLFICPCFCEDNGGIRWIPSMFDRFQSAKLC